MPNGGANPTISEPAYYCIRARGALDARWIRWLHEMELVVDRCASGDAVLTLRGRLPDQAALMGVLNQLNHLGLPLISVELLAVGTDSDMVLAGH
ncbi:hypothetical protein [Candidatus Chloroploca sp. Khr17]|uniref:hypothetical protein n=1 Tax=Candidatus Chloroploca sp. Khr17 TaxID=2496869 RepID=UPI00101CDA7F|nr:hypothetical protein [Candidatus Chloroploca sp. Khr17]NCC35975.1 hypothetical protein [Chloroflexia bacterium]